MPAREEIPQVEEEHSPPKTPIGEPVTPKKKSLLHYVIAEYFVYLVVIVLLGFLFWVNLWVAYFHGGPDIIPRFQADGDFLFGVAAVFLVAFEIRRAKEEAQRRLDAESRSKDGVEEDVDTTDAGGK